MSVNQRKFVVLVSLLLIFPILLGCSPKTKSPALISIQTESRLLSFPPAYYDYVVYFDNKLVAFSHDTTKLPSESISFASEGDTSLSPFKPSPVPTCDEKSVFNLMGWVLPDGRLGILVDCFREYLPITSSILAYDWQTGELEQIVKGPIAEGLLSKFFTWNPQMTKGVQQMGNGIEGTIYWISSEGASPMDIEIEDQGLTWNLKDYFEGKRSRLGSASTPAWSPDGKSIAFFASAYGIREEPLPKMNAQHALYIMGVSDLEPVQVIPRIADAFRLHWSPDSKRLLFGGCMGSQLKCGFWLYNVDIKSIALIDQGSFQDFTWITDEKIAAIKNITTPFDDNEIWEYSISQ
ncbi:MAG TPA: hypothetical protein VK141_10525 [Nitrosomonas sp.]|nr:hypothetical protein [Nitrosomonas sp.]